MSVDITMIGYQGTVYLIGFRPGLRGFRDNGLRDYHKVNVIRHETVSPDITASFWFGTCNEFQICQIILYMKKRLLPSVSTLGDMMGVTGNN